VELLVEPDDGFAPIINHIKRARRSIDTTIFRFDLGDVQRALEDAVTRGVQVRALIAHTNTGGEKRLRKLEMELLDAGVTLARSDDDFVRYHGKVLIIDRTVLYVMAFNYTSLDISKSRSFALTTRNRRFVQEALRLFEADMTRQPYAPALDELVVSPENARQRLGEFIKRAKRQLLIYDPKVTDPAMLRLLAERARQGVDVRVLGKTDKRASGMLVEKLPKLRLHARAIIRDGERAFVGSQSLRKAELDERREVGLIVRDPKVVKRLASVFESDWSLTGHGAEKGQGDKAGAAA
jgi:phosphatidylserine/phosphatidylglycerophosphate/cardiolipin synthase-like enzyme